ncbi:hypothetical protein ACJX0J_012642, partial [Zea mays]
ILHQQQRDDVEHIWNCDCYYCGKGKIEITSNIEDPEIAQECTIEVVHQEYLYLTKATVHIMYGARVVELAHKEYLKKMKTQSDPEIALVSPSRIFVSKPELNKSKEVKKKKQDKRAQIL